MFFVCLKLTTTLNISIWMLFLLDDRQLFGFHILGETFVSSSSFPFHFQITCTKFFDFAKLCIETVIYPQQHIMPRQIIWCNICWIHVHRHYHRLFLLWCCIIPWYTCLCHELALTLDQHLEIHRKKPNTNG